MNNTAQSTNLSSSTQHLTSLTSPSSSSFFHNLHHNNFQPIQRQPLISNGSISAAVTKVFDAGKINATATHIELEPQTNCTFTTLLNMSCRGRAEAFARSLQSRLRTLGSQVNVFNFNKLI